MDLQVYLGVDRLLSYRHDPTMFHQVLLLFRPRFYFIFAITSPSTSLIISCLLLSYLLLFYLLLFYLLYFFLYIYFNFIYSEGQRTRVRTRRSYCKSHWVVARRCCFGNRQLLHSSWYFFSFYPSLLLSLFVLTFRTSNDNQTRYPC
jgi:hypothetical protein